MAKLLDAPKYGCSTCAHCLCSRCTVFQRPVDRSFNRCFNHSTYKPFKQIFKQDERLEIIMKAEEEARKKHYKGWLAEDEKIRRLIAADIEKEKQKKAG